MGFKLMIWEGIYGNVERNSSNDPRRSEADEVLRRMMRSGESSPVNGGWPEAVEIKLSSKGDYDCVRVIGQRRRPAMRKEEMFR